jgi:hypothetical protein
MAWTKERTIVEIAATSKMAAKIYARMASYLEVVRRRLSAPLTLADKVLRGDLSAGEPR